MSASSTPDPIESPTGTEKGEERCEGCEGECAGGCGEAASAPTGEKPAGQRTFGGLTPREAALRRHAKARERQAAGETDDEERPDRAEMVLVPVRVSAVVKSLEGKAAQGDVNAARELRPWLDRYPQDGETKLSIATLTRRERDAILAYCLAELGETPAQEDIR